MCIISNGLFMSHIIPHSSLNNAWAGRMHRIGLMTWLFPGQSTLSAVHVVLHFGRRVTSEASNTGAYFWVTLYCDKLFFWAWDQCRGTSSLAWPAFDGQSRGHQYWICLWPVLDTFLEINYLRCIFVHLLTFSCVFLWSILCPFVETVFCCQPSSILCIYSVHSDGLHSRHLPQDFHTTASRADLE